MSARPAASTSGGPGSTTRPAEKSSAQRWSAQGREVRALTGLRGIAALWVLLFHWQTFPGPELAWPKEHLYWLLTPGYLGVDVFYCLSGFVITMTYAGRLGPRPTARGTASFLWARLARMWPAYVVVVTLFGFWLLWRHTVRPDYIAFQTVQPQLTWWSYVQQLAMVQLWTQPFFDGTSWVGPTWSVSAEWLVYCVFPLLALLLWRLRRLAPSVLLGAAMVVAVVLPARSFVTGVEYFPYSWAARVGLEFLAGALVCLGVHRLRADGLLVRWCGPLLWLAAGATLVLLYLMSLKRGAPYGVAAVVLPAFVGLAALATTGLSRLLSSRPLVHLGRISYSLYLVHVPLLEVLWTTQQSWWRLAPGARLTPFVVWLMPLLIVAVAHVLWRFVEEPARRVMRRRDPLRHRRGEDTLSRPVATP